MRLREALDVYRGYRVPHLKLIEHKNRWFAFSGILILLSLIGLFGRGLNYSIDFEGGAQITYPLHTAVTAEDITATMATYGLDASVQIVSNESVAIRTTSLTALPDSQKLREDLAKQADVAYLDVNVADIGPTWGAEISRKALRGLLLVLFFIGLYIALRFEWTMAMGAMIALVHDIVITAGIYALTGREVTPETVIAILTILGFSLYDTVVIYDKVQENTESPALMARLGYVAVVNRSLNQTLMRSVNTSLVVLIPILSLLLFGGATLKNFAFAMFVGVAIGAYSSIFVAAPILTILKTRQQSRVPQPQTRPSRAKATATVGGGAAVASDATARQGGSSTARPKSKKRPPGKRKRR